MTRVDSGRTIQGRPTTTLLRVGHATPAGPMPDQHENRGHDRCLPSSRRRSNRLCRSRFFRCTGADAIYAGPTPSDSAGSTARSSGAVLNTPTSFPVTVAFPRSLRLERANPFVPAPTLGCGRDRVRRLRGRQSSDRPRPDIHRVRRGARADRAQPAHVRSRQSHVQGNRCGHRPTPARRSRHREAGVSTSSQRSNPGHSEEVRAVPHLDHQ